MENLKDTAVFVSEIFKEKPERWGLRGDPYLWDAMGEAFAEVPATISLEMFSKAFAETFEKLTGSPLEKGRDIYSPEYAHGGMSSGQICADYWIEDALPLLSDRLKDLQTELRR